jgi:hypothetical protein
MKPLPHSIPAWRIQAHQEDSRRKQGQRQHLSFKPLKGNRSKGERKITDRPSEFELFTIIKFLKAKDLTHIKIAKRGMSIALYCESEGKRENRCRFTKLGSFEYSFDVASSTGRWEATPHTGTLKEVLGIAGDCQWLLQDYSDFFNSWQ